MLNRLSNLNQYHFSMVCLSALSGLIMLTAAAFIVLTEVRSGAVAQPAGSGPVSPETSGLAPESASDEPFDYTFVFPEQGSANSQAGTFAIDPAGKSNTASPR